MSHPLTKPQLQAEAQRLLRIIEGAETSVSLAEQILRERREFLELLRSKYHRINKRIQ